MKKDATASGNWQILALEQSESASPWRGLLTS